MLLTINIVLDTVTSDYLNNLDVSNGIDSDLIEAELLEQICLKFDIENGVRPKGDKWSKPRVLPNFCIAKILLFLYPIKKLVMENSFELVIYQYFGENQGLYVSDNLYLSSLIRCYNKRISQKDITEVISILMEDADTCEVNTNPDLIAVNNGIFDYKNKELRSFTADMVFISKSHVDYNPNAQNITIHNDEDGTDWDVESWLNDLSDDAEIVNLIWQVLGAIIRPHVPWGKAICMYSTRGNNGKGTLCELMRNLCGNNSYASISFGAFADRFSLQQLMYISAIITDENDVRAFNKAASALKAVITGDCLSIDRKFKEPITIRFHGLMVQCVNDYPKFLDKSESLYRRFLMIPFLKCFTGQERKYIKSDYLHRPDVLEYVLYKTLNMNYYEFIEPAACKSLLDEYKIFNDPIRQFIDEVLPLCVWDLLPFGFLYELYKAWFKKNSPSGEVKGKNVFIKDIQDVLIDNPIWQIKKDSPMPTRHYMDKPEPLILEYDLNDWKNPVYRGINPDKICSPKLKGSYKGLLRN